MSIASRRLARANFPLTPPSSPIVFNPGIMPLSEAEIVNSGRGQYEWLHVPPDPSWWPVIDVYERDELKWPLLEPSQGVYDMTAFERGLSRAAAMGGRYAFRIMTWLPDGPSHDFVPMWIPVENDGYYTPLWNSEAFLSGWENLMAALGAYAADDPRLLSVDYGGYGSCGEWLSWTNSSKGANDYIGSSPITPANATRMMRAVNSAFPNKPKLASWTSGAHGDTPETAFALGNTHTAIRVDYVGCADMPFVCGTQYAQTCWQRAPMFGEWGNNAATCTMTMALKNVRDFHMSMLSSGNHPILYDALPAADKAVYEEVNKTLGFRYGITSLRVQTDIRAGTDMQVRTTWVNDGIAPTYDTWQILLVLSGAGGEWRLPLSDDLHVMLGEDIADFTSTVTIPRNVPGGQYTVGIIVADPRRYLPPLKLSTVGRNTAGVYPLGKMTILAALGGAPAGDLTPPSAPTVTSGLEVMALPYIASGTAEPNNTVVVYVASRPLTMTADASGNWSVSLPAIKDIGQSYSLRALAVDAADNESPQTAWNVLVRGPILASDTFNRANGGLGTATSGQVWSSLSGSWNIVSGAAVPSSGENIAVVPVGQANVIVSAGLGNIGENAWIGLRAAYSDEKNTYGAESNGASGNVIIFKIAGGTNIRFGEVAAGAFTTLSLKVKAYATGTMVNCYADNKIIAQYIDKDANRPSGANAGMACGNYATPSPAYDNFRVESC